MNQNNLNPNPSSTLIFYKSTGWWIMLELHTPHFVQWHNEYLLLVPPQYIESEPLLPIEKSFADISTVCNWGPHKCMQLKNIHACNQCDWYLNLGLNNTMLWVATHCLTNSLLIATLHLCYDKYIGEYLTNESFQWCRKGTKMIRTDTNIVGQSYLISWNSTLIFYK